MRRGTLMTAAGVAGLITPPVFSNSVIYDNGLPDGVNGYSNGTVNAFGARRTLLDDFTVGPDGMWLQGLRWRSVWGTPGGGAFGIGVELTLRSDAGGTPGSPITDLVNIVSYSEVDTGNIFFSREEHEHWAQFDKIGLSPGTG